MTSISELIQLPSTATKVLEILTKEAGVGLPTKGIIAGQSVLSALNQLASDSKRVIYNDIDIFNFKKNEKIRHKVTGLNTTSVYFEKTLGDSEYSHLYTGVVRFFNSKRKGPLNLISVRAMSNEDYLASEDHLKECLLKTFDINSVQVAVDLQKETLFWEPNFIEYLTTDQLRLSVVLGPIQSLLRVLNKEKTNQGFLDIDYAFNVTLAALLGHAGYCVENTIMLSRIIPDISRRSPVDVQISLEKELSLTQRIDAIKSHWEQDKSKFGYSSFSGPVFGKKYFELYQKFESRLQPYFELVELSQGSQKIYYPLIKELPEQFITKIKPYESLLNRDWSPLQQYKNKSKKKCLTSFEKVLNPSTKQVEKDNIKKLLDTPEELIEALLQKGTTIREFNRNASSLLNANQYADKTKETLMGYYKAHSSELKPVVWACENVSQIYESLNRSYKSIQKIWGAESVNKAFAAHHKYFQTLKEMRQLLTYEEQPLRERLKQEPPRWSIKLHLREVNGQYMYAIEPVNRYGGHKNYIYVEEEQEQALKELANINAPLMDKNYLYLLRNVHMLNLKLTSQRQQQPLQPVIEKDEELFSSKLSKEFGENNSFKVKQLRSEFDLEQEGEEMSHCVGGYTQKVSTGACSIWHLQDLTGLKDSTLEVGVLPEEWKTEHGLKVVNRYYIAQHRAHNNKSPDHRLDTLANVLIESLNSNSIKELLQNSNVENSVAS